MKLSYRVHSASPVPVAVPARLADGTEVVARVPMLEFELVPEGHAGSTLTPRFRLPPDKAAIAALIEAYPVGGLVVLDFPGDPPAAQEE